MVKWVLVAMLASMLGTAVLGAQPIPPKPEWKPAGWGGGGFYWSVVFHPTREGTLYLGGDVLGVYRSTDAGESWQIINNGLAGYEVLSLAVSPAEPAVVYAATSSGICRSDDEGDHWTLLDATAPTRLNLVPRKFASVRALAVDPRNPRRLYFASPDGRIATSDDAGTHWRILHHPPGTSASSVAVLHDSRVLIAGSNGITLFPPGGEGTPKVVLDKPASAVAPGADRNTLYAAMGAAGVYLSRDGGTTWSPTGAIGEGEVVDVAPDPKRPATVHAIVASGWSGAVLRSDDSGKTWNRITTARADASSNPTDRPAALEGPVGISSPRMLAVSPVDGNRLFIAANWRPLYSGDGGKSWEERSRGADIACITDIRFLAGKTYVTAMDMGLLVRDDASGQWTQLAPRRWSRELSGHQWRVRVWDAGQQILTTSSPWDTPINQVVRSLDGGTTIVPVKDGLDTPIPRRNTMWERGYPRALAAADPTLPYTVYLAIDGDADDKSPGGGIYRSTDGGWHWEKLPNQPPSKRVFFALGVDPGDPRRIHLGTCGDDGGLYRSEDAGATWQRIFDRETWIFNLHLTPDGTLYAAGKQLYRSRDHGNTWETLTDRTDNLHIVGLETDGDRIWYSTISWSPSQIGDVYESRDNGKSWTTISQTLSYRQPMVLRYNPANSTLFAGGTGLFTLHRP